MDSFFIFVSVTNMESIGGTFRNLFRWQQDQQQVNIMVLGMLSSQSATSLGFITE